MKPNIVLIMVDDMGFSDIGSYGSEIETPNLDRLAEGGVRFSQMYNCARCCPTRASLLTGLHPHQAGVGHMVADRGYPSYQGYLRDDCVTVAEVLRDAGYRTLMSGKWHVGGHYAANQPETWHPGGPGHPIPIQRGFEEHYGMLGGGGSYFDPPYMVHNDRIIRPGLEEGYYLTDGISAEAVRMIEESAGTRGASGDAERTRDSGAQSAGAGNPNGAPDGRRPFFLYVAYTAPHWPLHALPEDIERYRGRYLESGWDGLRNERFERLQASGVLDPRWPISPRDPEAPAWEDIREKEWEDLRMAVYAAQVHRMDAGVGRIVDALERTGVLDDTLIMFLSDNGGCAEFLAEDGNRAERFRYDIPLPDGTPMRIGNTPRIDPGPADTFASYDLPWANASNTPFRLFKHWVHEGGIATPFIAHWPKQIPAGGISHEPAHVTDITATCIEVAGATYPRERSGVSVTRSEGESFLAALEGRSWRRDAPIIMEHEGNCVVRWGQWKLVRRFPGPWELYDMIEDRTELDDRAERESDRLADMTAAFDQWAERVGVVPWDELSSRGR